MLHVVLLLLAAHHAAPLPVASSSPAAGVRISNVEPRTTVGGATLPAHDGGVYLYGEGEERGRRRGSQPMEGIGCGVVLGGGGGVEMLGQGD